jgi:hypothetical protein
MKKNKKTNGFASEEKTASVSVLNQEVFGWGGGG